MDNTEIHNKAVYNSEERWVNYVGQIPSTYVKGQKDRWEWVLTHISYYCQCRKKDGRPVGFYSLEDDKLRWVRRLPLWIRKTNVRIGLEFNNYNDKDIKEYANITIDSGATTVLKIYQLRKKGTYTIPATQRRRRNIKCLLENKNG